VEGWDELEALARWVGSLPTGTEVRRVASTELGRLKRIPPQNAEHGVVRNYVRTNTFFLSVFSRFARPETAFSLATSSNGSPRYHGFPHPRVRTRSRGLTFFQTQRRNSMRMISVSTRLSRLSDGWSSIFTVAHLQALIAQEAEMEQTKVQEVTLKKAVEGPSARR
jgi:hypothetical protein